MLFHNACLSRPAFTFEPALPTFYLMAIYPPRVNERFRFPRYAGRVQAANGVGTAASFECGCFVRISLAVEPLSRLIRLAGFQTNGCGFMTAAADLMAEILAGANLTELHALDENEFGRAVSESFGPLPAERMQCIDVVLEAARAALADHRSYLIEEFRGEKALICTCFGISEETIEAFISAKQPRTVEDVTAACRAGAGCGSCRMLIQEMIDQIQA